MSDQNFEGFTPYDHSPQSEPPSQEGCGPWGPGYSILWAFVVMSVWWLAQALTLGVFAVVEMAGKGVSQEGLEAFVEETMVNGDRVGVVGFVSGLVGVALILYIVKVRGVSPSVGLSLRKPRQWWMWLLLLPGWYVGMMLITAISLLFSQGDTGADQQGIFDLVSGTQYPILLFLGVSVGAPFFEEFLFRGLLHEGLRQSVLGRWGSGIVIAALFSVIHTQYSDPSAYVALFLLGLLFTAARELTGSLWPAVVIHCIHNTSVTLTMILVMNGTLPEKLLPEELRDLMDQPKKLEQPEPIVH